MTIIYKNSFSQWLNVLKVKQTLQGEWFNTQKVSFELSAKQSIQMQNKVHSTEWSEETEPHIDISWDFMVISANCNNP